MSCAESWEKLAQGKQWETNLVMAMENQTSHIELQRISAQICRPAGAIAVNTFQWHCAGSFPAHTRGINAVTVHFYSLDLENFTTKFKTLLSRMMCGEQYHSILSFLNLGYVFTAFLSGFLKNI